jgi:hypothetical protein
LGTDLNDNCNVKIEAGSNIPKLQSAEKALLLQLAQIGTLNLEDPVNKLEFNKRMGVVGFDNEAGPDSRRAEWENDIMNDAARTPDRRPVMLNDDQHAIHVDVHTRRMKEPSFLDAPQEVQDAYMAHVEEHKQAENQLKLMEAQEASLTGQPPQPKDDGKRPPQGAGKGISSDMQQAIAAPDLPKVGS